MLSVPGDPGSEQQSYPGPLWIWEVAAFVFTLQGDWQRQPGLRKAAQYCISVPITFPSLL